jgi:uncharacterized protein (TIGR01777 family)
MRIIVAGGTGFLGRKLQSRLANAGHSVGVLTRRAPPGGDHIQWTPDGTVGAWAPALDGADVVINLAGEGIADARWTRARKAALRDSRILSTRSIAGAIRRASRPPAALLSVSGVGYYGDRGPEPVTETTPAGGDFLARLCVEWEREAGQAADLTRVVIMRNGVVLESSGGALARMLLPFRLGLGGPLGAGTQYLPWIHLEDWMAFVMWSMSTPAATGAFNVTAPTAATNAEFTRALGAALRRPAFIPVPAFGLKIVLGELADTLLTGQRAIPKRAEGLGFTFRFREIEPALRDLVRR